MPVVHGDARGSSTPPAAGPTSCGWRWPGGSAKSGLGDAGRLRTRSTCAWSARPARPNARPASTWPGSRASFLPTTGRATARRSTHAVLGNVRTVARWGSRLAPVSNWLAAVARTRMNEHLLGIDRRRTVPRFQRRTLARLRADRQCRRRGAAVQRHLHQLLRAANRPRRARRAGRRRRPHRDLRPTAAAAVRRSPRDSWTRRPGSAAETPRPLYADTRPRAARSCSASRAACRPFVKTRPRCCAAKPRRKAEAVANATRAVRGIRRHDRGAPHPAARAPVDPAPRPLSSEVDGTDADVRSRCSRRSLAPPSSTSTPAAAGWPARSDTHATTTRSRARSASARLFPAVRARADWNGRRSGRHLVPAPDPGFHGR